MNLEHPPTKFAPPEAVEAQRVALNADIAQLNADRENLDRLRAELAGDIGGDDGWEARARDLKAARIRLVQREVAKLPEK
ncbi:hypothetical protein HED60_19220 [Planctomycetales bacterium ZRK34]|nr:hypothetical protein HED60_19220 [Planctomycetales bacterium ZRK34]